MPNTTNTTPAPGGLAAEPWLPEDVERALTRALVVERMQFLSCDRTSDGTFTAHVATASGDENAAAWAEFRLAVDAALEARVVEGERRENAMEARALKAEAALDAATAALDRAREGADDLEAIVGMLVEHANDLETQGASLNDQRDVARAFGWLREYVAALRAAATPDAAARPGEG